jgi:hypothetical protein
LSAIAGRARRTRPHLQETEMKNPAITAHRRPGVILMVVLAMLTLFAIVGITFVLLGDAARPGNRQFQQEVGDLGSDTFALAVFLGNLLPTVDEDEGGVLSAIPDALDRLSARAGALRVQVRQTYDGTEDPAARTDLSVLDLRLEAYQAGLCQLREIIELIIEGS